MVGCFKIYDKYIELYESLRFQCEKVCADYQRYTADKQKREKQAQSRQTEYQRQQEIFQDQLKKIQVYLNIAKSHIPENSFPVAKIPVRPYDAVAMQRLLTKITMGLPGSDMQQLYKEAAGQKIGVEHLLKNLAASIMPSPAESLPISFAAQQGQMLHSILNSHRKSLDSSRYHQLSLEAGVANKIPTKDDGRHFGDSAGILSLPLPRPDHITSYTEDIFPFAFREYCLSFPLDFDVSRGSCTYIGYNQKTKPSVLSFVKRFIVHTADNLDEKLQQVLFIDPFRLNDDLIRDLSSPPAPGEKSILITPSSREEIRTCINDLLATCHAHSDKSSFDLFRMCILLGYPDEYEGELQSLIRQLSYNAEKYRLILLLLNPSCDGEQNDLSALPADAGIIFPGQEGLSMSFSFSSLPASITFFDPPADEQKAIQLTRTEKKEELDNRYIQCLQKHTSLTLDTHFRYSHKGQKKLINLPYAITTDGTTLLTTSLEGTETFGFVYGATRSGKSTFLHALITSIILTMHPDDVELWLVDFKMTEFNRYIDDKCRPPHVRYVLLEDSPEMVRDLIDRLMEVYNKRQIRFSSRKWKEVGDVPQKEYFTSIFVLIDEFNVMSSILNQLGEEEYRNNLEFLITKAAAFGIHILFSSQNFSFGLAGLSSTAKGNIGWRASLIGTPEEKAGTLEIRNQSDRDARLISSLQRFHVLVRRPADSFGNQLDHGKVLFFPKVEDQMELIQLTRKAVTPAQRYSPDDTGTYISKKPEAYDGYRYVSFLSQTPFMHVQLAGTAQAKDPFIAVYPGQPRRMRLVQPVELRPFVGENMLIVGNPRQTDDMISMILSIAESCQLKENDCELYLLLVGEYEPFQTAARLAQTLLSERASVITGSNDAAECLEELKQKIPKGQKKRSLVLLLDAGAMDQTKDENDFKTSTTDESEESLEAAVLAHVSNKDLTVPYQWLLENGAQHGCHIISILKAAYELNKFRPDSAVYRHRIFFSAAQDDARDYVKKGEGKKIETMPSHTFRYSNEMEAVSYRPYLHSGTVVNGMTLDENGNPKPVSSQPEDEPDYLD